MQQRNVRELLGDVLAFGQVAREYTAGNAGSSFTDSVTRRAVERCLQIVGEAVTQLVSLDPEMVRRISDAQRIIAFRHLLTHHYYRVSPQFILQIVRNSLPQLEHETANLLATLAFGEEDTHAFE